MAKTLQDLRDIAYAIMREEQNSTAYPYTLMDSLINTAQLRICSGRVKNPMNGQTIRKGILPFLNSQKIYSNVQSTTVSVQPTIGDTIIQVSDTTNFPNSGVLYIDGEFFAYTSKTSTSFIGTTGIHFPYLAGTRVSILFVLPTDYMNPINLTYNNSFKVLPKSYDDIFEDLNKFKGTNNGRNSRTLYQPYSINPFYSIIDNKYLALYQLEENNKPVLFRYERKPTTMTQATDEVIVDSDEFALATIPYVAVGEMLYNRGEEQRGAELLNFGLGQLQEMYAYYNNSTYEKLSGTQYKIGKSSNSNF